MHIFYSCKSKSLFDLIRFFIEALFCKNANSRITNWNLAQWYVIYGFLSHKITYLHKNTKAFGKHYLVAQFFKKRNSRSEFYQETSKL